MTRNNNTIVRYLFVSVAALFTVALTAASAASGEYAALAGVKQIKAVFDVSLGSPRKANGVFWAVKNVSEDENVRSLNQKPRVAVVFRGPAVKLVSTDRQGLKDFDEEWLDKFAGTIRQMKKDGVTFEVCLYAVKVQGVDPATIMPEVDKVGNGFISVAGYQAQGYAAVTID